MKKINMKKDQGFIQYVFCIMLFAICSLVMLYSLRLRIVQEQKQYIEDAITNSALASAVININEYGTYGYVRSGSNNVWDEEEEKLLNKFKDNLKINLNLDDGMNPTKSNGIISSQVKIVNYWIYDKELANVPGGTPIKDYNGNWVARHYEKDNTYVCLKYRAAVDKNGIVGTGSTKTEEKLPATGLKTPLDKNIVTKDAGGGSNGTDGAGRGQIDVKGMTIYCTVQFSVNPFGYNKTDSHNDSTKPTGLFGVTSLVGDTTITKSVVVSVNTK